MLDIIYDVYRSTLMYLNIIYYTNGCETLTNPFMYVDNSPESRNLFLIGAITQESVQDVIRRIADISSFDEDKHDENPRYKPRPIILHIDSEGGSVYHGFALIGAIENSSTAVYTVCYGMAMSMALAVFLAGDVRFVHRFAQLMYHEIAGITEGNISDHRKSVNHMDGLQKIYDDYVISRTKITQDELEAAKEEGEWFISAETAIKLEIAEYTLPVTPEQMQEEVGENEEEDENKED